MMMASIDILNDDCLDEVFSWLTLRQKCAVQRVKRRWQYVIEDMIARDNTFQLVVEHPKHSNTVDDYPNAYFSKELEDFFVKGVLNDVVKGFFVKFADKRETPENDLVISSIHNLAIISNLKEEQQEKEYDLEVPARSLELLLTIFTNLKSLSVDRVSFGDDTTDWTGVAQNVANLKSFVDTSCGDFSLTAFESLVNGSKNLRELKTNYLDSSETEQFKSLESLDCCFGDTNEVIELLPQHPKLKKIKCNFGYGEPVKRLDDLLASFRNLPFLRDVDLSFKNETHLEVLSYCQPLPHIQSLTLRKVQLMIQDLLILFQNMPSLSNLALLDFCIAHEFGISYNSAKAMFLNAITNFTNLENLSLEYVTYFDKIRIPKTKLRQKLKKRKFRSHLLPDFLNVEKLPKLRRLACNLFDIDDCFEAFCDLASANPKKWYAFKDIVREIGSCFPPMKLSDFARKGQPRNVIFFGM